MKKLLLWGQPLINRITRSGIIVATHNVTQPAPPPHIVDITQNAGTCTVVNTGTGCTATSTYTVQGQDFTPPVDIVWSVESPATIISGQGTVEITVQTNSNTATTTYDVTCTATDVGGTDTMTKTFSETRTVVPKITITDIVKQSGGSCEFPTSGTCQSVATFTATTTGGQGTKTYNWSANNGVVLTNANTPTVTATTPASSTNLTYDLTCVIGDETGSAQLTEPFTDSKTLAPPVGTNWTLRSKPNTNAVRDCVWGSNLYVAVGAVVSNGVTTSPDGINWTAQTIPEAVSLRGVAYGNNLYVAVANSGTGSVITSPDGINWTSRTASAASQWDKVAYGNGVYVAVAPSGTQVMTSPDGITWTSRTAANTSNWINVCYGNGIFVATARGGSGSRVMTSPDGITWTSRTHTTNSSWVALTYGNGLFVAMADSGTVQAMTSPDGITWTDRPSAALSGFSWFSVCYSDSVFVAVGSGGRVATSPDGITWTATTSPMTVNLSTVCYSPTLNQCVAASGNITTQIMTSP